MNPHSRNENVFANYQFSSEELRVLRECNAESFFQRSLPLGTTFGLGAYYCVKNRILQPNVKYGAAPKIVVGVIMGYIIGKFSYQQKCAEKIMQISGSKLGELLKQRKRNGVFGNMPNELNLPTGLAVGQFSTPNSSNEESLIDTEEDDRFNLDFEARPTLSGLDEMYRPSIDNPGPYFNEETIEKKDLGITYESLRNKNRREYNKNQTNQFTNTASRDLSPDEQQEREKVTPLNINKNKYGDISLE